MLRENRGRFSPRRPEWLQSTMPISLSDENMLNDHSLNERKTDFRRTALHHLRIFCRGAREHQILELKPQGFKK
jgi:hypothetical protein